MLLRRLPFLILLMLLLSGPAWAQQNGITEIQGKITDFETKKPVSGVSIHLLQTGKGTTTGADGTFRLQIPAGIPVLQLRLSHLGYEARTINVNPETGFQTFTLKPKSNTLGEVKIAASRKTRPRKLLPETVLDFEVSDKILYVLSWEPNRKNPVLQLLDRRTDTLLTTHRLPFMAQKLYRDCLQNFFLFSGDQVYQLYPDSLRLQLYPPFPAADFEKYIEPCVAYAENHYYLRQNIHKGLMVNFFAVNEQNHNPKLLRYLLDKPVLTMQQSEQDFQNLRADAANGGENNLNRNGNGTERSKRFAEQIMFQPPYLPMHSIGPAVALFDHLGGQIEFYRRDSLTHTVPINYQQKKDWAKQIVIDPVRKQAYALFSHNGVPELKRLDLETGSLGTGYKIPLAFARKLTVYDGRLYCIFKDPSRNLRDNLYAAPLE